MPAAKPGEFGRRAVEAVRLGEKQVAQIADELGISESGVDGLAGALSVAGRDGRIPAHLARGWHTTPAAACDRALMSSFPRDGPGVREGVRPLAAGPKAGRPTPGQLPMVGSWSVSFVGSRISAMWCAAARTREAVALMIAVSAFDHPAM